MNCTGFDRWLSSGEGEDSLAAHARTCEPCRRRARLHRALGSLAPVQVPEGMDERILAASRRPVVRPLRPVFLRAAAALLALFAGLGALILSRPGEETYHPRYLQVVEQDRLASSDPEEFLEEVYGPVTPILIAEGGGRDASDGR